MRDEFYLQIAEYDNKGLPVKYDRLNEVADYYETMPPIEQWQLRVVLTSATLLTIWEGNKGNLKKPRTVEISDNILTFHQFPIWALLGFGGRKVEVEKKRLK